MWDILGDSIFLAQFFNAVWGAFCVVMIFARIRQKRFTSDAEQASFLEAMERSLAKGDYAGARQVCAGDRRALCQLAQLAIDNRSLGYAKVRQLLSDRLQRDVIADLEHRLNWVSSMIKVAPMLGLIGTVFHMMAAFAKLSNQSTVQADQLAGDISYALTTTVIGLCIAVPLIVASAKIATQMRKMEDQIMFGLNQFLELFRETLIRFPR
jgi:biopolymer transport protein ExbB/TolQ